VLPLFCCEFDVQQLKLKERRGSRLAGFKPPSASFPLAENALVGSERKGLAKKLDPEQVADLVRNITADERGGPTLVCCEAGGHLEGCYHARRAQKINTTQEISPPLYVDVRRPGA
jgi:hypothetical protein